MDARATVQVGFVKKETESLLKVFFFLLQSKRQEFLLTNGKGGRVRGLRIIEND